MVRRYTDVEVMKNELKKEMIKLGLQKNASKTEYNKRYNKEIAPSPSGVLGRTNMKWQELMAEFGFAKKQKSGSKQYGITRTRRKWDATEKNELTLQVVDLIHKYKIRTTVELRQYCKQELDVAYNAMQKHGISWDKIRCAYYEKYHSFINPNDANNFLLLSKDEIESIVVPIIRKNGFTRISHYSQWQAEHLNFPSFYIINKIFGDDIEWFQSELDRNGEYFTDM